VHDNLTDSLIRVIIVEDEAPARSKLVAQLNNIDGVALVAECAEPLQAIQDINRLRPDVVLLDIELGELSGFDVLAAIEQPCHVIFTTAYSHYAVAAFEKRALDYLLKPFDLDRLREAFARVELLRNISHEQMSATLSVKTGDKTYRVQTADICFVTSVNGVAMMTCVDREYHLSISLNALVDSLPATFIRVHRNCIINSRQVSHIEKWRNGTLLLRFYNVNTTVTTSRRGAVTLRTYLKV